MKALVWRMDTPMGEAIAIIGVADRFVIFREHEWRTAMYASPQAAQEDAQRLTGAKQQIAPVLIGPVAFTIRQSSWHALARDGVLDDEFASAILDALAKA